MHDDLEPNLLAFYSFKKNVRTYKNVLASLITLTKSFQKITIQRNPLNGTHGTPVIYVRVFFIIYAVDARYLGCLSFPGVFEV